MMILFVEAMTVFWDVSDIYFGGWWMLRDAPTTFWRWTFRRLFFYQGHLREKNLSILAAAGSLSLDASSGLLATASASTPAMFLALGSRLLWCWSCMT